VKAVCRSDIQGQKGGAGTVCSLLLITVLLFTMSGLFFIELCAPYPRVCEDVKRVNVLSEVREVLVKVVISTALSREFPRIALRVHT